MLPVSCLGDKIIGLACVWKCVLSPTLALGAVSLNKTYTLNRRRAAESLLPARKQLHPVEVDLSFCFVLKLNSRPDPYYRLTGDSENPDAAFLPASHLLAYWAKAAFLQSRGATP